jgi:hypothetical protein
VSNEWCTDEIPVIVWLEFGGKELLLVTVTWKLF